MKKYFHNIFLKIKINIMNKKNIIKFPLHKLIKLLYIFIVKKYI